MATLSDLLSDPSALIELVVVGNYLDESDTPHTVYISQSGWMDPVLGPSGSYFPPLLSTDLQVDQHLDPLRLTRTGTTYSELLFENDSINYPGYFDSFWRYSVDGLSWSLYAVGYLADGTRVNLADVITTPLAPLTGIGIPEVSDSNCRIRVRNTEHIISSALQPETYSPACLVLPGTTAGAVSLGDVLDLTGSGAFSFWVWTSNPAQALAQIPIGKGTNFYVAVGLVLGGTVIGGVELSIGAQTPSVTVTSANMIRARQWHQIDVSIDTAAGTRRIDVDKVTAVTTAGVTGTPTGNSTALTFGSGLKGMLARVIFWSAARTNAVMSAEGRIPIVGSETSLAAAFLLEEGAGPTIRDRKSGSVLTGTLGTGTTWGTAGYHLPTIAGQRRPFILGTVLRAPITWIDTGKQVGELSYGGVAITTEVQSNHNAVSSGNYTVNRVSGILTLTSGSISGTYSSTTTANNFWNAAILSSSSSTALATINSPVGRRTMTIQCRLDATTTSVNSLIGWRTGVSAGSWWGRIDTGNKIGFYAVNDAGDLFSLQYTTPIIEFRTCSVAFVLDPLVSGSGTNTMQIHLDGEIVASVAITGNWTTVRTQFGVGTRPDTSTESFVGRWDEPLVFSRALSQAEIRALHLLPATGSELITYGWHMDDATGTSAAPFAGATSLTLANITWTGGRSAAVDLARKIYYLMGKTAADLDEASWRSCLSKNPADCGWFIKNGETALAVLDILLGGLRFVRYESVGVIYLGRFEGVSGSPDLLLTSLTDLQSAPIESSLCEPPIWQWSIVYATNNTRMDQGNVAQAIAATDPDRYEYGAVDAKHAIRSDYSIKRTAAGASGRFPNAEPMERVTALIYERDAKDEAEQLLPLHKHGADVKEVPAYLLVGAANILTQIGFDEVSCEMDATGFVVIGVAIDGREALVVVWRPAVEL